MEKSLREDQSDDKAAENVLAREANDHDGFLPFT
jgi:hypothetical protein